jgi:hypothetical protein
MLFVPPSTHCPKSDGRAIGASSGVKERLTNRASIDVPETDRHESLLHGGLRELKMACAGH